MEGTNRKQLNERLEDLDYNLIIAYESLEALENSLYFASERRDKDITKPCVACLIMIIKQMKEISSDLEDIKMDVVEGRI